METRKTLLSTTQNIICTDCLWLLLLCTRQNPTPAYCVILVCWAASLAIGLPIMLGLNHRPEEGNTTVNTQEPIQPHPDFNTSPVICAFYNPDFIIWSSIGSFYIPCLVMVILYSRIFKVSSKKLKIYPATVIQNFVKFAIEHNRKLDEDFCTIVCRRYICRLCAKERH